VVLPEPVGPVNNNKPLGLESRCTKALRVSSSNPSFSRLKLRLLGSKMRTTIFSPRTVGKKDSRNSTPPYSGLAATCPSCGRSVW
jgi:hypothetical protein